MLQKLTIGQMFISHKAWVKWHDTQVSHASGEKPKMPTTLWQKHIAFILQQLWKEWYSIVMMNSKIGFVSYGNDYPSGGHIWMSNFKKAVIIKMHLVPYGKLSFLFLFGSIVMIIYFEIRSHMWPSESAAFKIRYSSYIHYGLISWPFTQNASLRHCRIKNSLLVRHAF